MGKRVLSPFEPGFMALSKQGAPASGKQANFSFDGGFGAQTKTRDIAAGKKASTPFSAEFSASSKKGSVPLNDTNVVSNDSIFSSRDGTKGFSVGYFDVQTVPRTMEQANQDNKAKVEQIDVIETSNSTSFDTFEPNSSSSRLKPKIPSKPQDDMYERMQIEQDKRKEYRTQKNIKGNEGLSIGSKNDGTSSTISDNSLPGLADEGPTAPLNQKGKSSGQRHLPIVNQRIADDTTRKVEENSVTKKPKEQISQPAEGNTNLEEKRNLAKEKVAIEEEPRINAEEKVRLEDKEKQANEKKRLEEEIQRRTQRKKVTDEEGREENTKSHEIEDERIELSNEDKKENHRMKEIQELAREQVNFEVEAKERGFTNEQKVKIEKTRMDRLQKLAREQAQIEYDRKQANFNKSNDDVLHDKASLNLQNGVTPLRSTDALSTNEDKIRNQARQQSKASDKEGALIGSKKITQNQDNSFHLNEKRMQDQTNFNPQIDVSQFQSSDTPSNEEIMQDLAKQSVASEKDDVLVGINKKNQDQGSAFHSNEKKMKNQANVKPQNNVSSFQLADTPSNEEIMQDLVKQSVASEKDDALVGQFKKKNATETELHSKESNEQIIDVEGFAPDNDREIIEQEEDTKQDQKEGRRKKQQEEQQQKDEKAHKLEEKARLRTRQQSLKNKNTRLDNGNEKMIDTKSQNRQQLEAQARQRSKQQSPRNGRNRSEVKDDTVRKGVSSKAAIRSGLIEEEHIQKDVKQNQLQAESRFLKGRTALNEQQKAVADAIMKLDSSYKPSADALANTSMMLKQVYGSSISNYKGSKELLHKKSNVSVYAGRPLSIPVRVPTHPTYVEFLISKNTGEFFDFGILAVPDKGYAVDVKKLAPFAHLLGKGQQNYRDT